MKNNGLKFFSVSQYTWYYCGHWFHEFSQQSFLAVSKYFSHHFSVKECLSEFCGLSCEWLCSHCFNCSLVSTFTKLTYVLLPLSPVIMLSRYLFSLYIIVFKVMDSLWVLWTSVSWYQPSTEHVEIQSACNDSIKSFPQNLWKFFWKFKIVKQILSCMVCSTFWMRSSVTIESHLFPPMHICALLHKLLHQYLNITIIYNSAIITIMQMMMDLCITVSFCL